jgi:hypothetical protein
MAICYQHIGTIGSGQNFTVDTPFLHRFVSYFIDSLEGYMFMSLFEDICEFMVDDII